METNSAEASKRNDIPSKISHPYVPVASFGLLNKFACQLKRSRSGEADVQSPRTTTRATPRQVLSAESISRVAKMKSLRIDTLLPLKEPRETHEDADDDLKDIQLAVDLTLAAEKISNREFDDAEKLLSSCQHVAVAADTPTQKVVHYFAEALQERIDIDKRQIDLERKTVQVEEFPNCVQPDKIAYEVELPFSQITKFVATQAIMESVGSASRVHIIDFTVRSGSHWPILMHAIANRENFRLELLKLTVVGVFKDMLEETGRRSSSFAESMNLPFSFKVVLSELEGFKTDLLELEDGEVVAVYLNLYLASLVVKERAWWRPCTTNMNEKSMIISWKGTPIKSISAWKFPRN